MSNPGNIYIITSTKLVDGKIQKKSLLPDITLHMAGQLMICLKTQLIIY